MAAMLSSAPRRDNCLAGYSVPSLTFWIDRKAPCLPLPRPQPAGTDISASGAGPLACVSVCRCDDTKELYENTPWTAVVRLSRSATPLGMSEAGTPVDRSGRCAPTITQSARLRTMFRVPFMMPRAAGSAEMSAVIFGQWCHAATVVVSPFVAETRYYEASHPGRSAHGRWTRDVSPVC